MKTRTFAMIAIASVAIILNINCASAVIYGNGYCFPVYNDSEGNPFRLAMNGKVYVSDMGPHTWADHDTVCMNADGINAPQRPSVER